MSYIGTNAQDPNYFASEPGSIELEGGTYNQDRLYNSSTATVTGDITLTNNLVLARITDKGNNVTLTSDGTTRTITGSGKIESGNLVTTLPGNFTGMTGEIGSAVTGNPNLNLTAGLANASTTFPAGHIIQTVVTIKDDEVSKNTTSDTFSKVVDASDNAEWKATISNLQTDSDVLIHCSFTGSNYRAGQTSAAGGFGIYRDDAILKEPSASNIYQSGSGDQSYHVSLTYVDESPSSTSHTYFLGYKANWSGITQVRSQSTHFPFTMILQEIKK